MSDNTSILIVGVGGQGTLLTARILAQVAVQLGNDVKVSEVHGMAQRGGSVVSQVRYGEKIYSPIVPLGGADIILAFEKLEAARWLDYLKKDGMVIINNDRVDPLPVMSGKVKYPETIAEKVKQKVNKTIVVNATDVAVACGNVRTANVVLLGVLTAAAGLPVGEVEAAIRAMVPAKALDVNIKAFQEGSKLYNPVMA